MTLENNYGIVPPSGEFGKNWPVHHNIPAGASGSLSTGGWTIDNILQKNVGNEGFIQQTFLGGSVRSFDLNAGFGDTTSTLNVQIVNDEFNSSDGTPIGMGDDPYHSGVQDTFLPPIVGSPVYFKFGKNFANIEQAFRQTFDNLYKVQTLPTKTNRNNAWGWDFPETPYDPENFNQLERYNFVDLTRNVIEDRSILWNSNTSWRGRNHFVFGGILQSYTQNKSLEGSLFSVTVVDPREILASVEVLLNNYQGTVFNNKNIINLYGFLEYDPSTVLLQDFRNSQIMAGIVEKFVDGFGNLDYFGISANWNSVDGWETDPNKSLANVLTNDFTWTKTGLSEVFIPGRVVNLQDQYYFGLNAFNGSVKPEFFPITGQGFSRRSDKGMPWYRISHGLAAIFQYYGFLPQEYVNAGFGGQINFRGYNYVVDFGGIPTERIPLLYYMDFDKIDLLSLAQELCDIISHDLYVTLLPVIDHPACDFLWKYNQEQVKAKRPENIVAGIIRLDAIDRTTQPRYGAIKSYLDELEDRGIHVENQDVGFELSNVVTDKFVVGAQEVDMYLFSTERDRDTLWKLEENADNLNILQMQQWDLRTQLQQQLIPYYGLLGNKAVSIPRGFGSFQQILLDARELDAFGVGNYYVATELELRAALVSFDTWKNFLLSYNDVYIEDISEHSAFFDALSTENDQINRVLDQFKANVNFDSLEEGIPKQRIEEYLDLLKNRQFAVTVPRCVWDSDRPYMTEDGYPASPCSPPFGYPLYYKRATRIGIVEAGVISVLNTKTRVVSDIEDLKKQFENKNSPLLNLGKDRLDKYNNEISKQLQNLAKGKKDDSYKNTPIYRSLIEKKEEAVSILNNFDELKSNALATKGLISLVENLDKPENGSLATTLFNIEKTARKHTENAKKVYEFIRKIADECLGKKFLVRIPKACNLNYNVSVNTFTGTQPYNVATGPFGFVPRPINADPNYASSPLFQLEIDQIKFSRLISEESLFHHYLEDYTNSAFPDNGFKLGISSNYTNGALKGNYNPFSESWEWNYKPEPQGGFYSHSLFGTNLTSLEYLNGRIPFSSLPLVMQQGLLPIDVQNLLSDSNRMQCYVKYNHSHTLDFTGVNPEDITQQTIEFGGQFVPDIVESLPNNNIDAETSFDSINELTKDQRLLERKKDSVAFVKCEIEERLYLPPKLQKKNLDVWANEYEMKFSFPEMKLVREIKEDCTGGFRNEFPRALPVFSVPRNGGKDGSSASWTDFERRWDENLNGWIVNTDIPQLDDEHVYALITVPGRIKSTIDVRWKDGPMQAYNTWRIKHLMTQDVVKIPEFSKPSLPSADLTRTMLPCGPAPVYETQEQAEQEAKNYGLIGSHQRPTPKDVEREKNGGGKQPVGYSPGLEDDWIKISLEEISSARRITKKVLKGFALGQPQIELGFTSPSPVFPDLIAIPLMSQERCYGPWLSASQLDSSADARIKYSNIGGRVEFIKDENLAPWNYAGYQLMDQAGSLQAQFSNSLLLFSERGGFVIPDAPTGIALATALKDGGPLITSIGIQVDPTNGVKTTVKMDLYTSRFGKLQKQKEMAISQIARERQRLLDEKNNAIRRGLGKRQTSADLVNTVMQAGGKRISDIASEITRQINTNEKLGREIQDTIISVGDNNGAVMTKEDATRLFGLMDRNTLARQFGQNVIAPMASILQAYSNLPNSVLPSVEPYVGRWFNDRLDNKNQE